MQRSPLFRDIFIHATEYAIWKHSKVCESIKGFNLHLERAQLEMAIALYVADYKRARKSEWLP